MRRCICMICMRVCLQSPSSLVSSPVLLGEPYHSLCVFHVTHLTGLILTLTYKGQAIAYPIMYSHFTHSTDLLTHTKYTHKIMLGTIRIKLMRV